MIVGIGVTGAVKAGVVGVGEVGLSGEATAGVEVVVEAGFSGAAIAGVGVVVGFGVSVADNADVEVGIGGVTTEAEEHPTKSIMILNKLLNRIHVNLLRATFIYKPPS